jgi:hypothetical protein
MKMSSKPGVLLSERNSIMQRRFHARSAHVSAGFLVYIHAQ